MSKDIDAESLIIICGGGGGQSVYAFEWSYSQFEGTHYFMFRSYACSMSQEIWVELEFRLV